MRLCDSDSEGEGEGESEDEIKSGELPKEEKAGEVDDVDMEEDEPLSEEEDNLPKLYGEYKGEKKFLRRVRRHEMECMKLPFPNFDYKDIGDTLLDLVGKSAVKINQKLRNQTYSLVKRFHEMANGIFPLDGVNPSIGRRLRGRDYDAAAKRLLELDEEISNEKRQWRSEAWKERKRNRKGQREESEDTDDSINEGESENSSDDGESSSPIKDEGSLNGDEEEGSPKPVARKNKKLSNEKPLMNGASQLGKSKKLKRELSGQAESVAPTQKDQLSKKRRRLEDEIHTPALVDPIDFMLDPKARKAAAKRRKRKARVMKQKAAKLARMSKVETNAVDTKDRAVVPNNTVTVFEARKKKHPSPSAVASPLTPNKKDKVLIATTAPDILIEDTEAFEHVQATAQNPCTIQGRIAEEQGFETNLFIEEFTIGTKESPTKSSSVEMEIPKLGELTSQKELLSPTPSKTPQLKKRQRKRLSKMAKLASPIDQEKNSDLKQEVVFQEVPFLSESEAETVAKTEAKDCADIVGKRSSISSLQEPIIGKASVESSDLPQPNASPSPKRKVDFVTLWTPSEKKSPASGETPGPRRSARTAKNAALVKKPTSAVKTPRNRTPASKNRYYDEVASRDFDQAADLITEKSETPVVTKSATPKTSPMVQFEDFVKTPPAFFKVAVKKVTPKKTPSPAKKIASVEESDEVVTKSAKKVNFSLTKNTSQGLRHYAMSLRSRPGIPFNADMLPTQGVLKASPPVKVEPTPRKRKTAK